MTKLRFAWGAWLLPLLGCGSTGATGAVDGGDDVTLDGSGGAGSDATAATDGGSGASTDGAASTAEASSVADASSIADATSATDGASMTDAADAGPVQSMAIPMYTDPPSALWTQVTSAAPVVSLVVANPNSGPGTAVDAAYTQAIAAAQGAGQTILGYVHTSYGARAIAQVEADIDSWYSFYPAIDGIFSDETATDASEVAPFYAPLYAYVKAKSGKRVVVINPGTPPDESYMTASDIVLSFEDTYANYTGATTPAWVASYPATRFWHVVLSTAEGDMTTAVGLARQRNAGLVYVTDQGPSTAYQEIVTGGYWSAEVAAAAMPKRPPRVKSMPRQSGASGLRSLDRSGASSLARP